MDTNDLYLLDGYSSITIPSDDNFEKDTDTLNTEYFKSESDSLSNSSYSSLSSSLSFESIDKLERKVRKINLDTFYKINNCNFNDFGEDNDEGENKCIDEIISLNSSIISEGSSRRSSILSDGSSSILSDGSSRRSSINSDGSSIHMRRSSTISQVDEYDECEDEIVKEDLNKEILKKKYYLNFFNIFK
jgi:hypothetical protein